MTLRIRRSEEDSSVVLTLVGRIQSDQLPELEAALRSETAQSLVLVLDLKDVRLVDLDSVRFLAQSEARGATLRNCSAFVREWISQERNKKQRAGTERP